MNHHQRLAILVVEDDPAVRQTVRDMLQLNNYDCIEAENGTDGLALARRDLPSLIVTDIEMPGLTGYDLLAEIRRDESLRAIPVIVITAKADRIAARRGMDLGADDYITKPFTEDELIRSVKARLERKELLDELDAFAHTVAHDLKNPLGTLMWRLGLLEMTLGQGDLKGMRHNVREATAAASRLGNIIDELLLLAGVRRMNLRPEPLDMRELVAESLQRLEELMKRSGTTVELPEKWPTALGYGPWVVHVWSNYLSNAAKYAGPSPKVTLGGEIRPDGRRARFWVRDCGAGLNAEASSWLFVPFTRITSVRAGGHGLGLSIVRRIVEKLDGTVGVETAPGAGSCFWFELPLATDSTPK